MIGAHKSGLVLLVEDDDSMREAVQRLLECAGLQCVAFISAEQMLAQRKFQDVTCVVSDLKLPGMSGLDLMGVLKAQGSCPPIIVITAHDAPGLREEAARRGATAYLAKPFRGTALLDVITRCVQGESE